MKSNSDDLWDSHPLPYSGAYAGILKASLLHHCSLPRPHVVWEALFPSQHAWPLRSSWRLPRFRIQPSPSSRGHSPSADWLPPRPPGSNLKQNPEPPPSTPNPSSALGPCWSPPPSQTTSSHTIQLPSTEKTKGPFRFCLLGGQTNQ